MSSGTDGARAPIADAPINAPKQISPLPWRVEKRPFSIAQSVVIRDATDQPVAELWHTVRANALENAEMIVRLANASVEAGGRTGSGAAASVPNPEVGK